jgi:hypothetical protein
VKLLHKNNGPSSCVPEDFPSGSYARLCVPVFNWPVGALLKVTGTAEQDGRTYVMIAPVSGAGVYGVHSTDIEPHKCRKCPHPRNFAGYIDDIIV